MVESEQCVPVDQHVCLSMDCCFNEAEILTTPLGESWTLHLFGTCPFLQKINKALLGVMMYWLGLVKYFQGTNYVYNN